MKTGGNVPRRDFLALQVNVFSRPWRVRDYNLELGGVTIQGSVSSGFQ